MSRDARLVLRINRHPAAAGRRGDLVVRPLPHLAAQHPGDREPNLHGAAGGNPMKRNSAFLFLICFGLLFLLLAGCAAPAPTGAPVVKTVEVAATQAPAPVATEAPAPATAAPTPVAVPTPVFEDRSIELEWPAWLRLGELDVLRLALVPSVEGYTARAEFAEHTLESKNVALKHYPGYTLYGIARLDGVGFQLAPTGEQRRMIPVGEPVAWRWSLAPLQPGKQRLSVSLVLRWEPDPGYFGPVGESLYSIAASTWT